MKYENITWISTRKVLNSFLLRRQFQSSLYLYCALKMGFNTLHKGKFNIALNSLFRYNNDHTKSQQASKTCKLHYL